VSANDRVIRVVEGMLALVSTLPEDDRDAAVIGAALLLVSSDRLVILPDRLLGLVFRLVGAGMGIEKLGTRASRAEGEAS